MKGVDWHAVRRRRLARSFLATRAGAGELVRVVGELCGVQAQLQSSAELQLSARVDEITRADVGAALWERRELVKAWTVRGTLHLHPAPELPMWLAARRAVSTDADGGLEAWRDPQGVLHAALSDEEVRDAHAAVWDALDGRCLLREELAAAVAADVSPAVRRRLSSGFAFFLSEVCQGPPRGAKVTFVRPDQWVPAWAPVDEEEALREVCRRFVRTYGPTRPGEFREWFGGPAPGAGGAQALFESIGGALEPVGVDGRDRYVLVGDAGFESDEGPVRLVPEYDAYVMGFRERDHLVPEAVRAVVARSARGRYEGPAGIALVLVDGVAAGLWRRKKRGRRIELHVALARSLSRARRAELEAEAERVARFAGLELELTLETA